jgi:hypothetical protein
MAAEVNEKENARKMRICLTSLQPWVCDCFHGDLTKSVDPAQPETGVIQPQLEVPGSCLCFTVQV